MCINKILNSKLNSELAYDKIREKIDRLSTYTTLETDGYWRFQLEFLESYIAGGVDSELLRFALNSLKIDPLEVIEDIHCFYDSSSLLCCDIERLFISIHDEKIFRKIKTFNVGSLKIQYPVPNKYEKFDGHKLMTFDLVTRNINLFVLQDNGKISRTKYKFRLNGGCEYVQ